MTSRRPLYACMVMLALAAAVARCAADADPSEADVAQSSSDGHGADAVDVSSPHDAVADSAGAADGDATVVPPDAEEDADDSGAGVDAPDSPDTPDAPDGVGDADADAADTEPPPPPCTDAASCDDGDACTVDACTKGTCTHQPADCDDGDPCTDDSCSKAAGCSWTLAPSGGACCYEGALLAAGFEGGSTNGFFVADMAMNVEQPVLWQPDTGRARSGSGSLYFGIPSTHTYDNGLVVAASATTAPITLPAGLPARLSFWAWLSVEEGKSWDVLQVVVIRGSSQIAVWAKDYGTPLEAWFRVEIDLSAFANDQIQVRFVFDSADATYNEGEGVYIDDVRLLAMCKQPPCTADADCDDGIACTDDSCAAGACTYGESATCCLTDVECDDDDACTVDYCDPVGGCIHSPVANPLCCNSASDCDDGNACTTDQCAKNECKHLISQEKGCCGTKQDCDDGDACTVDSCDAFQCYNQNVCCASDAECNDGDDVCTTDSCVEGGCVFAPTGVAGCCAETPGAWSFDGPADDWTFTNAFGPTQGFQVWTDASSWSPPSPPGVLYYGSPAMESFDFGSSSGTALGPEVELDSHVAQKVTFAVWRDTEQSDYYDMLRLFVVWSGGATQVWVSGSGLAMQQWVPVEADLSAFAGQKIRLRFDFATNDAYGNQGLGVMVDELTVSSTCQAKPCGTSKDCDDKLTVSTEACESGVCTYTLGAPPK